MPKKARCELDGCGREARYKISDKKAGFIPVCGTHDKQIGRSTLLSMGWDTKDAIRWESKPDDY